MTKKVLLSIVASLGVLVGGLAVAYAANTFKAIQSGQRMGGEGQATRITMTVEAGMADQSATVVPDDSNCAGASCVGGALSFSISNTSDFPIRVTRIDQAVYLCTGGTCDVKDSNKNGGNGGSFASGGTGGDCAGYTYFAAPANYDNWPTIAAHSTLSVNGSDTNHLGANMLHLYSNTPDGCQGATFLLGLRVTAVEATHPGASPNI